MALLLDAVSDPIVGVYSDNFKSKLGRRHPLMYAAAIPLGIFLARFCTTLGIRRWGIDSLVIYLPDIKSTHIHPFQCSMERYDGRVDR